jgi:serine/threonine-protein kinase
MIVVVSQHDARLGRYRLEERIARGGMGEVFRAAAIGADGFEKPVVVKRLLPDLAASDRLVAMFASEAKLMTRLMHPNIVQVLDFGRGEGSEYFLVMELVDGLALDQFRRIQKDAPIPLSIALHIALQMLRGLGHAHGDGPEGLVHRDVSPSNVLLSRVGEVKVADFGIALLAREGAEGTHLPAGKPSYMAPEQYRAEPVDARADLFSAAVVLFETLTGELPFEGSTVTERQRCAMNGAVRRAAALRDDVPSALDEVMARALAPLPGDRYADAASMARALRALTLPIADADELAEAVRHAFECAPPARAPVIKLGARPAQPANLTQVTRIGSIGGFTLEVSDDLEGEKVSEPSESLRVPIARKPLRLVLAAVAAVALVAFALRLAPWEQPLAARPGMPPEPSIAITESDSAPSPAPGAPSAAPSPRALAAPSAAPVSSAASCYGEVLLFSDGSWTVTGGPTAVQSPGRYRWPCGSYALSASSRMDPGKTRSTTVVVRDGGAAVFDMR